MAIIILWSISYVRKFVWFSDGCFMRMLLGEIKSVYVRNLPPTVSVSEIEEEFKNFGNLKYPEGVVIRSRKVNVLGFYSSLFFCPFPFLQYHTSA